MWEKHYIMGFLGACCSSLLVEQNFRLFPNCVSSPVLAYAIGQGDMNLWGDIVLSLIRAASPEKCSLSSSM
jgi:hypothetical protein